MEEKSFEELLNDSMNQRKSRLEKEVEGTVINITSNDEIFVDLNYKADGIIPKSEYSYDENANPRDEFKPGDTIRAEVLKMNDGSGNVLLSYKKMKAKQERKAFEEKVKNNEVFEENVTSQNANGIIVEYNGIRIFIPNSLSAGQKTKARFRVIEYNPKENKVIGSCKVLVEEEKKAKEDKFWNEVKAGKEYDGTVTSISSYGAFVDLGGVQGLLHISEITWDRDLRVQDIFKVGQKIKVKIKELDKENKRIQLEYDGKGEDPWNTFDKKVGDVIKVTIKSMKPFGAFAKVKTGIDGLIHISQISTDKISKPEDKLKVGQKVEAKIIEFDRENRKLELSIKELEEEKVVDKDGNAIQVEKTASGEKVLWNSEKQNSEVKVDENKAVTDNASKIAIDNADENVADSAVESENENDEKIENEMKGDESSQNNE